ncbi:MAG: isoleucine--tRNA ligase [Verrucomicrobia bacterium]|nr:isoleucine--tRNA ligase [Verrucomicrobiota bacterium]
MSDNKKQSNTYKDSLNLPSTDFPMRANLVEREPERLQNWEKQGLYRQIIDQRRAENAPTFLLHDGPPFANGDVHMGTALNKVLKDLVIKSRSMAGFHTPFIPGWDCHGLPIEFKVVQKTRGLEPAEIRRRSEEYARKFIDIQRHSFRRLGIFADWENPYLTLDPGYEADVIRTFAKLIENDLVYCSKKPVLWSFGAQTALAEAEVEYEDRKDPAIFVKFSIASGDLAGQSSLVIWTTTPWTLPANLGIALQSRFEYLRSTFTHQETGVSEDLIIARPLLESFIAKTGFSPTGEEQKIDPSDLEGETASHPLFDRTSKIILADFVTDEAGTGAVHVAPGHGSDDYIAGQQNDLGLLSPVDDLGVFTDEVGIDELVGVHVFKSNERIIEMLQEKGALIAREDYLHSYPHCWRSKTPIIFRSVEQFFVRIDKIRDKALEEIDKVEWLPHWGRNRIHGTVESRPDWCISRQRTWGVPLPVFFSAEDKEKPIIDADLARKVADLTEEQGTNLWFEKDDAWWAEQLGLPAGTTRCHDTLDVWIDSGSSHVAVLDKRPELHTPADLYLEATDQHRGWFQSSLMLSVAYRGNAPYKTVMTHGFVVDKDRKKISKSDAQKKGKPMDAAHFYNKYGADILRLWVSSVDWQNEVPFDENLFKQTADTYRRIRNTLRILLGNINDFDAETQSVDNDELTLIDQWILERLQTVIQECCEAYEKYEFRKVFNTLNQFCAVDLSSLYIDITKDRMYCESSDSTKRRATQTAMARVFESLTRLLAPILVYTADEAWEFLGHKSPIHLERFPTPDPAFTGDSEGAATPVVEELLKLRAAIQQEIENARQNKLIGSNLEARVSLDIPENTILQSVLEDQNTVKEFLIVSDLTINRGQSELAASVSKTDNGKCARCWRHEPSVGKTESHSDLCERCADVVEASPPQEVDDPA